VNIPTKSGQHRLHCLNKFARVKKQTFQLPTKFQKAHHEMNPYRLLILAVNGMTPEQEPF
jgi:hypothetical protein